jgi:hypothetical protein
VNVLTLEQVKSLIEQPKSWSVSIYMPTIVAGAETRQNEIRFKNLIKEAQHQLQDNGLSEDDANEFLRPLTEAIDDVEFWQHQDQGLAMFVADGFYRYYKVPCDVPQLVVVSDQFHLKPLLPLLTGGGTFYLLELSQKQVRLFEGDRTRLREVQVSGLSRTMNEVLRYDESEEKTQFRIGTSNNTASFNNSTSTAGVFHGQGAPDQDDAKKDYGQFFHAVDRTLHEFINGKTAPLVLACVDYLMPIYREANTYPHLLETGISGNVKDEQMDELHQEAWAIVEPYFTQAQEKAVSDYHDLSSTELISTELEAAVPAAYYGRIDRVFVAVGVQKWGRFDPAANAIEIHDEAKPGDEDLLDAVAIQTLINGGTVYAVEPSLMPAPAPIAAVFRY